MPTYRQWSFADITLSPNAAKAELARSKAFRSKGNTGEPLGYDPTLPESEEDRALRERFHGSASSKEKLETLEDWKLSLHRTLADLTPPEEVLYQRRLTSLLKVAEAAIEREMRAAQLEAAERDAIGEASPTSKIIIKCWNSDITRIHESAKKAGLYSERTEVAKIVGMYHIERKTKDPHARYRGSASETRNRDSPSPLFLNFAKEIARQLTPSSREELIKLVQ